VDQPAAPPPAPAGPEVTDGTPGVEPAALPEPAPPAAEDEAPADGASGEDEPAKPRRRGWWSLGR